MSVDPGSRSDDPLEDAPLREEDVSVGDRLDDRIEEGDGLPESDEADD